MRFLYQKSPVDNFIVVGVKPIIHSVFDAEIVWRTISHWRVRKTLWIMAFGLVPFRVLWLKFMNIMQPIMGLYNLWNGCPTNFRPIFSLHCWFLISQLRVNQASAYIAVSWFTHLTVGQWWTYVVHQLCPNSLVANTGPLCFIRGVAY